VPNVLHQQTDALRTPSVAHAGGPTDAPVPNDIHAPDAGTACWTFAVENIDPVTMSHIHEGAEGTDGGVVVDLDLAGFDGSSEGCNDAADADTLQAIIDDPAGYYVNVHNDAFPGGAIRGQLAAASPDTAVASPMSPLLPILGVMALAMAIGIGTLRAPRARS
jgi:hypothetical protein